MSHPIDTAPTDGTAIMLYVDAVAWPSIGGWRRGWAENFEPWGAGSECWWFETDHSCPRADGIVTAWMPLPEPPE